MIINRALKTKLEPVIYNKTMDKIAQETIVILQVCMTLSLLTNAYFYGKHC